MMSAGLFSAGRLARYSSIRARSFGSLRLNDSPSHNMSTFDAKVKNSGGFGQRSLKRLHMYWAGISPSTHSTRRALGTSQAKNGSPFATDKASCHTNQVLPVDFGA